MSNFPSTIESSSARAPGQNPPEASSFAVSSADAPAHKPPAAGSLGETLTSPKGFKSMYEPEDFKEQFEAFDKAMERREQLRLELLRGLEEARKGEEEISKKLSELEDRVDKVEARSRMTKQLVGAMAMAITAAHSVRHLPQNNRRGAAGGP
ncbi:MAG: hypothetical protein SGARI_007644, partial [Bacillariaceae sp.]